MSNKKGLVILIAAIIVGFTIIGIAIAVFSFGTFKVKKAETKTITEEIETKRTLTEKELWGEGIKTENIQTPYMDFSYPKKWGKKFVIKKEINDINVAINFYGKDELEDICIFSIFFGEAKEGAVEIGKFSAENGDIIKTSYLVYENYVGCTDDQIESIQILQANVNEIIIQIYNNKNFISN